ncbi:MAG: hypothetical protein AABX47_03725 [Nanoarchaeota archaeon]
MVNRLYSFGDVIKYAKRYSELMEMNRLMEDPNAACAHDPIRGIKDLASSVVFYACSCSIGPHDFSARLV